MFKVPTYLKKENYKVIEIQDDFSAVAIRNSITADNMFYNELFDIYYFGDLSQDYFIYSKLDKENGQRIPCRIVAKCPKTGDEILLFDGAKYGYNSMFCDTFDDEIMQNRSLQKLEIKKSKIKIEFFYNIDYEEEKEDYEVDENDYLETINGQMLSWEDVKKNGFDFIRILAIDENEIVKEIFEMELA